MTMAMTMAMTMTMTSFSLPPSVHPKFDRTKPGVRTHLVNHPLVGVKVHRQARVVLLDDHARRLLDRLGTHALWMGIGGSVVVVERSVVVCESRPNATANARLSMLGEERRPCV
jgi:hypothetical protein